MNDKSLNNRGDDLYTHVVHFQSLVQQLLETIQRKVEKLPGDRDLDRIKEQIDKISRELDKLHHTHSEHDKKFGEIKTSIDDTKNFTTTIQTQVKSIEVLLHEYKDIIKQTNDMLISDTSTLNKQIKTVFELAKRITTELNNSEIVLKQDNARLQVHDLKEVIDFAKRANQRYYDWKGWKGKVAFIIGVFLGIGIIASGFVELANTLYEHYWR